MKNTLINSFLTVVIFFCLIGCTREQVDIMMHDDHTPTMEVSDPAIIEASFQMNIMPILTERCATAGCHVANGPKGLDLRTYDSFKAGSEHGPIFIPGNAEDSEVVEQIKSGNMPPGGPPLTPNQVQIFVDWINQQPLQESIGHVHDDDDYGDDDDHGDDDGAHTVDDDHGDN